ncbi:hypothetical protein Vafri_3768 [Volvox africanus]|uniref:Uncharacterized protein n=1 Tax=Volvox africanus TaxID=51714 RepID=A0A8J4EUC8_9CHLO|nr:hypothetical protein Vafri_3768 [Volvox africanus]
MHLIKDHLTARRVQFLALPVPMLNNIVWTKSVRRPSRAYFSNAGHVHPTGGSGDHCFALETMSEDGQGWVMNELGQKLVGLRHRTPRAACHTTQLLSYRGDLSEGDKAMRCDRLDLDLGWEATAPAAEGKTFTGLAKWVAPPSNDCLEGQWCAPAGSSKCQLLQGRRPLPIQDSTYLASYNTA